MAGRDEAPGQLRLVQAFVNTIDVETGTEELDSPAGLRDWLLSHDLPIAEGPVGVTDLERAVAVRAGLRALALANNGEPLEAGPVEALEAVAAELPLALAVEDGRPTLRAAGARGGAGAALARLLAIVDTAAHDGTWSRLKVCPWHTCQWAFYDSSRNRSGTWCSMEVCGNRAKARTYRARRRGATA